MKQSAVKTLGVAALGAALAATAAAGSASAAPSVPDAAGALDLVSQTLPSEDIAEQLPMGVDGALVAGRSALTTIQQTAPVALGAVQAGPAAGLLGGLPVKGAAI
ncbi:ATP-binding protein [Streptomyces liangshanensis]|uniref:ATP-binding protein n=1 Tax=Streptomyces liangshanensis TaxID=2717324 RepID=UPI0036D9FEA6